MIYEMYCPSCGRTFIGESETDTEHLECGGEGVPVRNIEQSPQEGTWH